MKILALGHRSRTGKDTAARIAYNHIRANYPDLQIAKVSFFNPIKDLMSDLFSWAGLGDAEYYENNPRYKREPLAAIGKSPMELWLEFGHHLRYLHPDTITEYSMKFIPQATELAIITDLRSHHEIDFCEKFNFFPVKVVRPSAPPVTFLNSHPAYLLDATLDVYDGWFRVIMNDSTIDNLSKQIIQTVEDIIHA